MASPAVTEAYLDPEDYPPSWIWDEDGESVSGAFVDFSQGQTRQYGAKPIVVLDVDGQKRSVWLNTAVLFGKFRDELRQRPGHKLEPGERVNIRRAGKVESETATGAYWGFSVGFPDRPELSTDDLFDLGDHPKPAEATDRQAEPEDGIPF